MMPDREKVSKGLEMCINDIECTGCPYENDCFAPDDNPFGTSMMRDALALIKGQKAVAPKQVGLYGKDEWWGLVCVCPDCKAEWMSDKDDTHFCPKCGRSVLWE